MSGSLSELLNTLSKYHAVNNLTILYTIAALAGPTIFRSLRRASFRMIDFYFDLRGHIRRRREMETAGTFPRDNAAGTR